MDLDYPEVYRSRDLNNLLNVKPELDTPPQEPKKPESPKNPGEYDRSPKGCAFAFLILGGLAVWILIQSPEYFLEDPLIALIAILGIPVALVVLFSKVGGKSDHERMVQQYEKKLEEYQENLTQYNKQYVFYEHKLEEYEEYVRQKMMPRSIYTYRQPRIKNWMRDRQYIEILDCTPSEIVKKGPSEIAFYQKLKKHFPEGCHIDKKVPIGSEYYYPDIIVDYYGLFIDIEIDEPYVLENGDPIHHVTEALVSVDWKRNKFFSDNGWETIRFAEEQICRYPDYCIKYIEDYIQFALIGIESFPTTQMPRIKKWTKEEAGRMAYKHSRDNYLMAIKGSQSVIPNGYSSIPPVYVSFCKIYHIPISELSLPPIKMIPEVSFCSYLYHKDADCLIRVGLFSDETPPSIDGERVIDRYTIEQFAKDHGIMHLYWVQIYGFDGQPNIYGQDTIRQYCMIDENERIVVWITEDDCKFLHEESKDISYLYDKVEALCEFSNGVVAPRLRKKPFCLEDLF